MPRHVFLLSVFLLFLLLLLYLHLATRIEYGTGWQKYMCIVFSFGLGMRIKLPKGDKRWLLWRIPRLPSNTNRGTKGIHICCRLSFTLSLLKPYWLLFRIKTLAVRSIRLVYVSFEFFFVR